MLPARRSGFASRESPGMTRDAGRRIADLQAKLSGNRIAARLVFRISYRAETTSTPGCTVNEGEYALLGG